MDKQVVRDNLKWAIQHLADEAASRAHNVANRPGTTYAMCPNPSNCDFAAHVVEQAIDQGVVSREELERRISGTTGRASPT